jgi:hypothetical protein
MNRAQAPAYVLFLLACASAPACGLNQAGVDPLPNTIAYPASAVLDDNDDAHWLFVTNSNADLRYNSGTLIALNLDRAAADRVPETTGGCPVVNYDNPLQSKLDFCCRDALDPNLVNCDERQYVGGDADDQGNGSYNVRIGSFAAGMVRQDPACPTDPALIPNPEHATDSTKPKYLPCDLCKDYNLGKTVDDRLLIGVRGDTSLTYVDIQSRGPNVPPLMKCVGLPTAAQAPGGFVACDADHRVITATSGLASPQTDNSPVAIPLPDEPYALAIDKKDGLLFIGHLSGNTTRPYTGGFSLFDIAPRAKMGDAMDAPLDRPRFIAPFPSPFGANSVGSVGVTALTPTETEGDGTVYASSRYVPQVAGLGTTAQCPVEGDAATPSAPVREIAAFPNGVFYNPPLAGTETRGIQFVDGNAFVLQRSPPALIRFENQYTPTDILETCSSPTFLDQYDSGVGPRLFVTCFADGEIYVYDPSVPRLVKTFPVGRGPSGLVFDRSRKVAYVVGFGDNNISVVDLAPGSPTEYHVVQHIGFPRVTPR